MADRTSDGLLTNMALRPLVQDIRHGDANIASDAAFELFNAYDAALERIQELERQRDHWKQRALTK